MKTIIKKTVEKFGDQSAEIAIITMLINNGIFIDNVFFDKQHQNAIEFLIDNQYIITIKRMNRIRIYATKMD